jgi:hypothetical protein
VSALEKALGRPCRWIPHAVDTLRFTPYPEPPARVVDVYSIGRRLDAVHRALLGQAGNGGILYVYDSVRLNDAEAFDHREHRDLVAGLAKRSRFFLVAPAKMNALEESGGQSELGSRYYEGAAAGAVLLGRRPASASFQELFGWPDAVVEIEADGSDAARVVAEFSRNPERFQEISRRNAREALLRHDWAYRWENVLSVAGLESQPALGARKDRLKALANGIGS